MVYSSGKVCRERGPPKAKHTSKYSTRLRTNGFIPGSSRMHVALYILKMNSTSSCIILPRKSCCCWSSDGEFVVQQINLHVFIYSLWKKYPAIRQYSSSFKFKLAVKPRFRYFQTDTIWTKSKKILMPLLARTTFTEEKGVVFCTHSKTPHTVPQSKSHILDTLVNSFIFYL